MSKSLATWFTPSLQTISRSAGRSSVAAAAYRACVKLTDQLTGLIHDYTRKSGHVDTILIGASSISELWNKAEAAENRRNSTVARELMLPLPDAWTDEERRACVRDIAQHLRNTYGVAVGASIHGPSRHDRNNHVHMMFTTREVDELGKFGKKTRILDEGLKNGEIKNLREAICKIVNDHAEKLNSDFYVHAGKFSDIDKNHIPTQHIPINAGKDYRNFVTARNVQIKMHLSNEAAHEKKAELLQAELANALRLEAAEKTTPQDAPRSIDKPEVEVTPPVEFESPYKRKLIPSACEMAYQKHSATLKKQEELKAIAKKWNARHEELLLNRPNQVKRFFAKLGFYSDVEKYDADLEHAQIQLTKIKGKRAVYKRILEDKKYIELIAQYKEIIDHNAKISLAEAQALKEHAQKMERERELAKERKRQLSVPTVDWTVDCDPTKEPTHDQSNSSSMHI